jgi:hypothetical protein
VYVERIIAEHPLSPEPDPETIRKLEQLERFFEKISANSEKMPLLPDEAFTRDGVYREYK